MEMEGENWQNIFLKIQPHLYILYTDVKMEDLDLLT